jgi:hypothetical protein
VGYNWKTYDQGTNTWSVEDSTSYFVQDKAGNLWQMTFTAYSGSATGNIKFGKRIVSAVGVNDVHSSLNQYSIFPVPTQTNLNVVMDSKESTEAVVMVFDFMGKVVLSSHVKLNTGLNAYILPIAQLANGNYILSVKGNSININEKVTIQH